ncbi:hypothetical protein [Myceligenerans indicum]|uniref:DUF2207 domain-containing protein n=1 Tax=Myceligenerans indicum TaxID=2593663 RepID=A0ABS1LIP1_9MICO|nr:hypothetical protein [Myceligenerans indicum]MBL0885437.1 DUF2207 domain-containing protein [Myceligenerans indicum]
MSDTDPRDIGPLDEGTKRILRPGAIAIGVGFALILAGGLSSFVAPALFAAVGGWITLTILCLVLAVGATLIASRRMKEGNLSAEEFDRLHGGDSRDAG